MVKPGYDADGSVKTEADHFEKCSVCGQWVDRRDLKEVIQHIHGALDENGSVRRSRPRRPLH
jgi:hypothetical protein